MATTTKKATAKKEPVVKTTKSSSTTGSKATTRKNNKVDDLSEQFEKLTGKEKLELLRRIGVGNEITQGYYFTCHKCGKVLTKDKFYQSTDMNSKSGVTPICKDCASSIAIPVIDGIIHNPDKATVDEALFALNKPFLEIVWDASVNESANTFTGKQKSNIWASYIKNISMVNYVGLTYRQSDGFTGGLYSTFNSTNDHSSDSQEIQEQFESNKDDALKLLGYLPFEKEKITDQPFLYAQLIGFLDTSGEGNEDMMRNSSIISIVRGFLQQSHIDDMIAELVQDTKNAQKNVATIKSLQETKKNIALTITKLAEQSCISLKNSKNAKKGENTWTGKIKKIKEMDLRNGEVNGFDMDTCRGMRQVIDMSNASILKHLSLDESEYSDMIAEMRVKNTELRNERDGYREITRILLRENLDIKDYLQEKGLGISELNLVNLKNLFTRFSDEEVINDDFESEYEPDADNELGGDSNGL